MSIMDLFVIRYYVLRHKSNDHIYATPCVVHGKVTLCPGNVGAWAGRFPSGRTSIEDCRGLKPNRLPLLDHFHSSTVSHFIL
jgi:hypothetical protein